MKKKLMCSAVLFIGIGVFASCNKNRVDDPLRQIQPIGIPDGGEDILAAQNQFAFNLFHEVLANDPEPGNNKLISPLSVYLALGMVYNGAAGETLSGMQKALQLSGADKDLFNRTNQALITGLPLTDPLVQMDIANSVWYRDRGYQPLSSFLETASNFYNASVKGADFDDPVTVGLINGWVKDNTNQKIEKIIDAISGDAIMYLINAIYFNGQWKYKFDKKNSQDRVFHAGGGEDVETEFMTQEGSFRYFRNSDFSAVELPYGDSSYSMHILLPEGTNSIADLSVSIDENTVNLLKSSITTNIKLWLPKWEYPYEVSNVKPELSALGMDVAFQEGGADFTGMYPAEAGAFVSKAIHKTYIKVDEKGTEVAAVTAVEMVGTTAEPSGPLEMDINRPFLYLITENGTGSVLFIGIVNNPGEE